MNAKTIVWILVVVFLAVVILGFISGRAKGDSGGRLSREEQIRIMTECISDAKAVREVTSYRDNAIVFFYYRTGMMPIMDR